jgi:hypothetical protein
MQTFPIRQGVDGFKFEAQIPGQQQGFALPQDLYHAVEIGTGAGGAFRGPGT